MSGQIGNGPGHCEDVIIADVRAIIYLRISSDRSGEEAGVQRQREDCERLVRRRGWTLVGVEQDNDQSASTGRRRPGYERVLAAIDAKETDVVVAWALDRLQRNKRDEMRLYETCQRRNVTIALVNGADLDFGTAAGRFVADLLGSSARFEVQMKSDRQRRAQEQAAKAGRRSGGRRPFGYEADGVTIREAEAAAVREGYASLLAGVPLAAIAREWNSAGLVTGQGRYKEGHKGEPSQWRPDGVRLVLRNPRYAGLRSYRGEIVAKAVWPAVVDEETYRAADALLGDPSRRRTPRSGRYLLSGLAVCGVCGAPVHAGGNARPGVRAYRCSGSMGHFARKADDVETYVKAVILERLSRADARQLLAKQSTPDTAALHTQANALRSRLDSLAADFAEGDLTASQLRTASARIRELLQETESQMADAGRVNVLGPLVGADDLSAVWEKLGVARQRAVIDALATVVLMPPGRGVRTFRPETVRLDWR